MILLCTITESISGGPNSKQFVISRLGLGNKCARLVVMRNSADS